MADLSNGTYWSETDASNNSASPNGWPEGMMPSGVNDSARADKGALKRFWDRINPVQTLTPAGGVWTFTTANASYPSAYASGELFSFQALANSGANDRFRVNALPALKIFSSGSGAAIKAYDIITQQRIHLAYDGGLDAGAGGFWLTNPNVPITGDGAGGATASGSLTVGGNLTANGNLSVGGGGGVTGAFTVSSGQLFLRSQQVLGEDALNTGWTTVFDNAGGPSIYLGNVSNSVNMYRQNSHQFGPRGGGAAFTTIDGSGITVTGAVNATGALSVTNISCNAVNCTGAGSFPGGVIAGGWGVTYSGFAATPQVGFGYGGSVLTAFVNGASVGPVITAPSGNISITGTLTAAAATITGGGTALNVNTGSANIGGALSIQGSGTALNVAGGNGVIAGTLTINGLTNALYLPSGNIGLGIAGVAINAPNGTINALNLTISNTATITGAATINGGIVLPTNVTITGGGTGTIFNNGAGLWAVRENECDIQNRAGTVNFAVFNSAGTANQSGAWIVLSDASVKQDVAPFTRGLAAITSLTPVTFRYRPGTPFVPEGDHTLLGLIAEDAAQHVPEIAGEAIAVIDGEERTLGTLQPSNLVYALINSCKEIAASLAAITARLDALEGEPRADTRPVDRPRPHRQ